jgi:hypothetical protein
MPEQPVMKTGCVRQAESYERALRLAKVRTVTSAVKLRNTIARYRQGFEPADTVRMNRIANVMASGTSLKTQIDEALKSYLPVPLTEEDDYDVTLKGNSDAFWFGRPDTLDERAEALDKQLEVARLQCSLNEEQFIGLKDLVYGFRDVFRTRLGSDWVAKIPPLQVKLKDEPWVKPLRISNQSMSASDYDQLRQFVDELEAVDLITPAPDSRWAARCFLVVKPGGEPGEKRTVQDYR